MKLKIRVQPNSSRQEIMFDLDGKITKVFLKKPSYENKANIELEKLLTKTLRLTRVMPYVAKTKAKIIKGHRSKNKVVEIN